MTKEKLEQGVVIKFVIEIGKKIRYEDKKRIVEDDFDEKRGPSYKRNDAMGLQQLLHKFNSKQYSTKEWGLWALIKEKLYECIIYDKKEMKLSDEEGDFLYNYLDQFPSKEGKEASLVQGEIEARQEILEQLEG